MTNGSNAVHGKCLVCKNSLEIHEELDIKERIGVKCNYCEKYFQQLVMERCTRKLILVHWNMN